MNPSKQPPIPAAERLRIALAAVGPMLPPAEQGQLEGAVNEVLALLAGLVAEPADAIPEAFTRAEAIALLRAVGWDGSIESMLHHPAASIEHLERGGMTLDNHTAAILRAFVRGQAPVVIRCQEYYVAGIDGDGLLDYAATREGAKRFDNAEQAAEWWRTNCPTLPPVGSESVRCEPAANKGDE